MNDEILVFPDYNLYQRNYSVERSEKTLFTNSASINDTLIKVENSEGFSVGNLILLGGFGNETVEKTEITSLNNAREISVNTLTQNHNPKDVINYLEYDKVIFFTTDSETVTSTSVTTLSTVDMQLDNNITKYKDGTGANSLMYTSCFFSTENNTISGYTPIKWSHDQILTTVEHHLKKYDNDIDKYGIPLVNKIITAHEDVVKKLYQRDVEYSGLDRITKNNFTRPISLLALYLSYFELSKNEDDMFYTKARDVLAQYNESFDETFTFMSKVESGTFWGQSRGYR